MLGRLNIDLAHDGAKLSGGDIIQLHMFTPLTYPPSKGHDNIRSPMVVIHTYSKVGYAALPVQIEDPMTCVEKSVQEVGTTVQARSAAKSTGEYEELVEVECTPQNRYCAKYGFSPVLCICKTDPPEKNNLDMVAEYCYFTTMSVEDMESRHKRNLLYWWYMTNHYFICGRGVTKEPPECLKAAIRLAYPEEDGKYTGYRPGKNSKSN